MAQFEIKKIETVGEIKIVNLEELQSILENHLREYKEIDVKTTNLKTLEDARSTINKFIKNVEDARKDVKKTQMQPYDAFALQIGSLTEMAQKVVEPIAKAIKDKEEIYRLEKRDECVAIFEKINLPFEIDRIYNPRWENKTFKIEDVEKELTELKEKVDKDLSFIDSQYEDLSIRERVKTEYYQALDLTASIMKINSQIEREKNAIENEKAKSAPQKPIEKTIIYGEMPNGNRTVETLKKTKIIKVTCDFEQWQKLNEFAKSIGVKIENA